MPRPARLAAVLALGLAALGLVGCGGGGGGGGGAGVSATVSGVIAAPPEGGSGLLVGGAQHAAVNLADFTVVLELADGRVFRSQVTSPDRSFQVGFQLVTPVAGRLRIEVRGRTLFEDLLGTIPFGVTTRPQVGIESTLTALLAVRYLGRAMNGAGLANLALPGGGTLDLAALRQRIAQNPSDPLVAKLRNYLTRITLGTATCSLVQVVEGTCGDTALGTFLTDLATRASGQPPPVQVGTSPPAGASGSATLVSIGTGGTGQGGGLAYPRPSTTGQFVAWSSFNDGDLVPGDSNGKIDCFVRDVTGGTTERVSVATAGQPDGDCRSADLSGDGSKVVYASTATNSVTPSPMSTQQAYLYDRGTTTTTLLSQASSVSGNQISFNTRISLDGAYACFLTYATNLGLTGTPPFLVRVHTGTLAMNQILSPTGGSWDELGECSLSGDGAKVAFHGKAAGSSDNRAYVSTVGSSITTVSDITPAPAGPLQNGRVRISADGNSVCWAARQPLVPGDTDSDDDIYVRDLGTSALDHVSVNEAGANVAGFAADCSISADGRYVAFTANQPHVAAVTASGVNHVYVRDRTGATTKVLVGPQTQGSIDSSTISPDGGKVVFATGLKLDAADQPGPWHFDAYVADRP